jgi:uncharacterized membrane protein YgcG
VDTAHHVRHRSTSRSRAGRTTRRFATAALAGGLVLSAAPAGADVPSGWPDPPSIPLLDGLVIYLFAPLGLFLLVVLLSIGPALARGERIGSRPGGDQWFGGRRSGPAELESGTPTKGSGGASGSW